MAPCQQQQQPLLPSFLYAPPPSGATGGREAPPAPAVVAGAPSEPPFGKIEMFSPAYYTACAVSGAAACGFTHTAVTPLDVIKCNIQVRSTSCVLHGFCLDLIIEELTSVRARNFPSPFGGDCLVSLGRGYKTLIGNLLALVGPAEHGRNGFSYWFLCPARPA